MPGCGNCNALYLCGSRLRMGVFTSNAIPKPTGLRISHLFLFSLLSLFVSLSFVLYPQNTSAGQITLAWNPPTTNANGTPLTDLAGYIVYYGTAPGNYSQNINVGNVTTSTVSNLTGGTTYYFAVTAYDAAGNQSAYSNQVSATTTGQYTLTTSTAGSGSGTVTSYPSGINCGTSCSGSYNAGTIVTLTATSASRSIFTGWSGGGCTGTGTCSISLNANAAVSAIFAMSSLVVTPLAGANGSISPSTAQTVNYDGTTSFTVSPNSGYHVDYIIGCGGTLSGNIYTTGPVAADCTVTAAFGVGAEDLNAASIPVPAGQQSFVTDPPVVTPTINTVPAQASPIGVGPVATGGSMVSILTGLGQFSGPVDIYFGIYAPAIDPVNIYILTPTGFQTLATAGLVPWISNTPGSIDVPFFGNIPISQLPPGTYTLYLGVAPTGSTSTYYLWETSFML
ncbi:MAG: fibronectin type III domain-containing protein [Thermodesulfovibrionales bacterium]